MELSEFIKEIGATPDYIPVKYSVWEETLRLAHIGFQYENGMLDGEQKDEPPKMVHIEKVEVDLPVYTGRRMERDDQDYVRKDGSEIILSHNSVLELVKKHKRITSRKVAQLCMEKYGVIADKTHIHRSMKHLMILGKISITNKGRKGTLAVIKDERPSPKKALQETKKEVVAKKKSSNIFFTDADRIEFAKESGFDTVAQAVEFWGGTWAFEKKLMKHFNNPNN